MKLVRNDVTYRMDNLPKLSKPYFILNGKVVYTGSIIKRPIQNTANIYKHWGIIYGFDINRTLWIIENNRNGVECVTFRDFMAGNSKYSIELLKDPGKITKIIQRAVERSVFPYDARRNSCEHFVNYCIYGKLQSKQVQVTEIVVDGMLSLLEDVIIKNPNPEQRKIIESMYNFRKIIELPRSFGLEKPTLIPPVSITCRNGKSRNILTQGIG